MFAAPKSKKRRYRHNGISNPDPQESRDTATLSQSLFIQAHEADLVRGPQALAAAESLEVEFSDVAGRKHMRAGSGLIQWKGISQMESTVDNFDEDHLQFGQSIRREIANAETAEEGIWVDRYDARLLLESLPSVKAGAHPERPDSPGGWSDLPSDAEDTFFFTPDETEEYHREKRRRLIDRGREDRLRALQAESEDANGDSEDSWGGSDEEPDEAQKTLIQRTASHIMTSPNPAQLEMRILANHGADRRFAFLRGRWSRAWRLAKTRARMEIEKKAEEERQPEQKSGIGGLAGYGSGDSDEESPRSHTSDADEEEVAKRSAEKGQPFQTGQLKPNVDEEELQRARRARAREWAEKRRILKAGNDSENPPSS